MGSVPNITAENFPKQGEYKGKRARVVFHYTSSEFLGTIIRDDIESPFVTIITLDDGRTILSTECQYSPVR